LLYPANMPTTNEQTSMLFCSLLNISHIELELSNIGRPFILTCSEIFFANCEIAYVSSKLLLMPFMPKR
jgi:hypothetical protein